MIVSVSHDLDEIHRCDRSFLHSFGVFQSRPLHSLCVEKNFDTQNPVQLGAKPMLELSSGERMMGLVLILI